MGSMSWAKAEDGCALARLSGRLTIDDVATLAADLAATPPAAPGLVIDLAGVTAIDTAGAWAVNSTAMLWQAAGHSARITGAAPAIDRLVQSLQAPPPPMPVRPDPGNPVLARVARVGAALIHQARNIGAFLAFLGQTLQVLGGTLTGRRRLRWHAVVHQAEAVGVNALGIIALLLFLVGLVVAQQGAVQLRQFGAEVFTVNLIGRATTRELGILLTAIMVAGRSGSAFAAQIGSMKLNQEVDALKTIGLDPIEVLVVPRVIACSLMLLGLAFYGGLWALVGGGLFAWVDLKMPPSAYVTRLQEVIMMSDFVVGMIKAPVFGFIIALMGCFQGMQVTGNAESVGQRTTQAVVEAIFVVIVFDAFFAVFFSTLGYN
ncbi:ABC transporter permease [Sandarakinorhabdus cyanobacteriorum]|uniref:ABC transporter permease n=2 Tax=Sandarakinorhabdus cyanobacteriorum TaxID=1981098 RepID=A0A255YEH6_9SPHN|nr:ABC transporter permease [Sandarakinorhabdus cyanobacteriorum]